MEPQLEDIRGQSHPLMEVVAADDGSGDGTAQRLEAFVQSHGLAGHWRLEARESNLGYPASFYAAMARCRGDRVYLADQDDRWHPDKISLMEAEFARNPGWRVLVCKFGLIDSRGRAIRSLLAPARSRESGQCRRVDVAQVLYQGEWPGMVMAYDRAWFVEKWRRRLGDREYLPLPHDLLLALWAAEEGALGQLDRTLAWHRRHDSNAGGEEHRVSRLSAPSRKLAELEAFRGYLSCLLEAHVVKDDKSLYAIGRKLAQTQARLRALESGGVLSLLAAHGRYREYLRLQSAAGDMLVWLRKSVGR